MIVSAMRWAVVFCALLAPAASGQNDITAPTTDFSRPERFETNQGGAGTFRGSVTRNAFSQPASNISFEDRADFNIGNAVFRRPWVTAPSSTKASDGLGPLFNARGCQRCHLKDGRGHPPAGNFPDDTAVSMLMRLSVPPRTEDEHALLASMRTPTIPEPVYGGQLQDRAIAGMPIEGRIHTVWTEVPVTLGDGTMVSLREPTYSITDLGYGPIDPDVMMSVRVAPQMIGLGLLEAIPEEAIVAHADPEDADGDGISGRPNIVWDGEADEARLGRFGLKSNQPTLNQQNSHAFAGDIGLSNPVAPAPWGDCTEAQEACRGAIHGDDPPGSGVEISDTLMASLLFYTRSLAVPARRNVGDPSVLAGKELFYGAGCAACHTPKFITRRDADHPSLRYQLIWPYTDLLLHDMGPGLADNRPDGLASGQEWRTAPLWGIGLTETVSSHTFFLHDGRARSVTEAILWHGGEAQASRDVFAAMSEEDRNNLLAFLGSL